MNSTTLKFYQSQSFVNSCLQVFKITKQLVKNQVDMPTVNQIHQYPTRSRDNFAVKNCNTNLGNNNFFIRGSNLFNSLPQEIKRFNSISIFKNRVREHFFEIYCNANFINI